MYTLGTHVQVVIDHQQLIPIYNFPDKPKQLCMIDTEPNYSPSSMMWCMSLVKKCHVTMGPVTLQSVPILINGKSKNGASRPGQIHVNRVLEEILPQVITLDILRRASSKDKTWQLLISYIKTQNKSDCKKHLKPYYGIFDELTEADGVILHGSQIVIPESLQTDIISLAHEGHQHAEKAWSILDWPDIAGVL